MKQEIKLGTTVRCVATGVQGYAMTATEMFNGNIRYGVQPKDDEDSTKMLDAWDIDQQTLDIVDDGISDRGTEPSEHSIKVGERVKDILSDFEGIVSAITNHFNGCVYCLVIPQVKATSLLTDAPAGSHIPVERLIRVDEGVLAKREEASIPARRTGGPSTKAVRV